MIILHWFNYQPTIIIHYIVRLWPLKLKLILFSLGWRVGGLCVCVGGYCQSGQQIYRMLSCVAFLHPFPLRVQFVKHRMNLKVALTIQGCIQELPTVLLWLLIVPADPHYRRDVCKSFHRTDQTDSNNSTAQFLLCILWTLYPRRVYSYKTFQEPRSTLQVRHVAERLWADWCQCVWVVCTLRI